MKDLLVVFGATGQQGGSLIDFVLNHPELSQQFKIRGISRSTSGAGAKALQAKGVEVVAADAEKPSTLEAAVEGAHTVFSNTATIYDDKLAEREISTGKAIADASVAAGAQYIIYSSTLSGGKLTGRPVVSFDCKAVVADYIRTLPIKSAFFLAGSFMSNYLGQQKPHPTGQPGEYALSSTLDPETQLPHIETVADSGKFIGAILADPANFEGKELCAASEMLTMPQVAEVMTRVTGKKVKFVSLPEEQFKQYLPEPLQEPLCAMFAFLNKPGYYGAETKERVAWSQAQALGKLTTLEDFLTNNPIPFD